MFITGSSVQTVTKNADKLLIVTGLSRLSSPYHDVTINGTTTRYNGVTNVVDWGEGYGLAYYMVSNIGLKQGDQLNVVSYSGYNGRAYPAIACY